VIADERGADRIAWLAGRELVVLDPTTGVDERRPAPDGANDPAAAASVALSLKTLLRLPPPPVEIAAVTAPEPVIEIPVEVPPPVHSRTRIVPEVGGGVRIPFGGTVDPQTRISVGLGFVQPDRAWLRPSVVVGFGPAVEAGRAGLQGTWTDVELGAQLAVVVPISEAWSIVPRARLAIHRTHLDGRLPQQADLAETAFGVEAGLDLAVWWRVGPVHAGAGVGAGALLALPDYERMNVMVFDSPTATGQVFGTVLVDL
jgi:hypothetical protein